MDQEYCVEIKRKIRQCNELNCKSGARSGSDKCRLHGGGKRCVEPNCTLGAEGKTDKCKKHGGGKRCIEPNCKTSASGKTDKCILHGGGKRCIEPNCKTGAEGKTDRCISHGGGKRCIEPNCQSSASGKTDKCKLHGGGKRCIEPNCQSIAVGKINKCVAHGGGKRCIEPNCQASSQGNTDRCIAHGGGRRCIEPNCQSSASGKTDKCITHGGGRRCIEPNCQSSAREKSDKCKLHGGGPRCPNCIDWIDSRCGSIEYDGYCATCFKQIFPNDKRSQKVYSHTKEILVRNIINANFEGFIHDTRLYTGNCDCTHRRRIDHRKLIGNTILAIETDEFGHRGYDQTDEEIRYNDLYMIHSGKWIFIRFNPDTNVSKIDFDDKLDKLVETINNCIYRIEYEENIELVEIIKLYC